MAASHSTRDVGTQAVESLVKQVRVKMSKLNVKEQFMSPPTDTNVYNEKGEQVITKVRSGTKGRFEEFADDYEVRQQARRSFLNGFLNKQMDFKSRSGDETLLCLYDGDRREKTWYSTNPAMLSYTDRHNTSSNVTTSLILESSNPGSEVDPTSPAPVASTPAPSPRPVLVPAPNLAPVPSFHELAAASPQENQHTVVERYELPARQRMPICVEFVTHCSNLRQISPLIHLGWDVLVWGRGSLDVTTGCMLLAKDLQMLMQTISKR